MPALFDSRVLILAADLFEDIELLYPLYRLREEGVNVVVASAKQAPVSGKYNSVPLEADADLDSITAEGFDAVIIPGGYAPDFLRRDPHVLDLVRTFDRDAKPVAFICHAGWVPISAGILSGRRATSVSAIKDDMINAGTDWVDEATVVDGNLISARTPDDMGPWMKALIEAIEKA